MQNTTRALQMIIQGLWIFLVVGLVSCQQRSTQVDKQEKELTTSHPSWITIDYVMGRFDPATHGDFEKIESQHADREGLYLRKDAYLAFKKMSAAAATAGIELTIRSAARNFDYQKGIWERKWTGATQLSDGSKASDIEDPKQRALKILLYSSMPGSSRHHWGTDIDLNSFDNNFFKSGEGKKIYDWLKDHAADYGYCQPYTDKADGRSGYEEERWHWTYTPISKLLTNFSEEHLKDDMVEGFQGSDMATDIGLVANYVLGIGKDCR